MIRLSYPICVLINIIVVTGYIDNRTEQNRIYFNKLARGTSFEIQNIHT